MINRLFAVLLFVAVLVCCNAHAFAAENTIDVEFIAGYYDSAISGQISAYNNSSEPVKVMCYIVTLDVNTKRLKYINIYSKSLSSGNNIWNEEIPSVMLENNNETKLFIWNTGLNPYSKTCYLEFDDNIIFQGSAAVEAENMTLGVFTSVTSDTNASNGKAVRLTSYQWYIENTTADSLYVKIYLPDTQEEGRYNMWLCTRALAVDASIWQDTNNGTYVANWFSTVQDGKYRWDTTNIYLEHGENYIAFRARTILMFDKMLITSNLNFVPENVNDYPDYILPEEQQAEWRTYWNDPPIKPIEGHPRLILNPQFIQTFNTSIKTSDEVSDYYTTLRTHAYTELNCNLDTTLPNNHNSSLLIKIQTRALLWAIGDETDIEHAKQTVQYMKDYLRTFRTPDDTGDITRSRGDVMLAAAIVYDWCYNVLTDADKKYFINHIIKLAESKEIGWPPTKMSSVSSHGGEFEIFRDFLSAGIAIYDEYPLLYDLAAGRLFDEMVPARNWLRPAGRFDIGNDYGECRYYSEVWADMLYMRMGYPSIYADTKGKTLRSLLKMRLPYGSMLPCGDMYSLTRTQYKYYYINYPIAYCIAGNIYKDEYLKGEYHRTLALRSTQLDTAFYTLIFTDPNVNTALWKDYDLSFYTEYPLSGLVAKTSWQDGFNSDCAMAFVDFHEIFVGDHMHSYTGDFQVYYKGMLAMNTGTYNSSSAHNVAYNARANSANTVLVLDPDETFLPTWTTTTVPNDGGQRTPYSKHASVMKLNEFEVDENGIARSEDLTVSENVRHYIGSNSKTPEFSYISGDLEKAYTSKVTDYKRSMVFIDLDNDDYPAAFIVYDKIDSSNKNFKKTWLLHSQEEPAINGNKTIIQRTEAGFNGKLVNTTLLPEENNTDINVVGGTNNEMFTFNGVVFKPKEDAIEKGNYRIEVSPKTAAVNDTFLNAMYVTDADKSLPELSMICEKMLDFVGVTVMNKTVLFSENAADKSTAFDITVRNNGFNKVSCLIADLSPGVWKVSGNGVSTRIEAKESSSCIEFSVPPGTYTITPDFGAADIIETTQMNKRQVGDYSVWIKNHDATSQNQGYFMYLEKPTKIINNIPYVPCNLFKELGATVSILGDVATIQTSDTNCVVTAGFRGYKKNDKTATLTYTPQKFNDTVYVAASDFMDTLGFRMSYKAYAKLLYLSYK